MFRYIVIFTSILLILMTGCQNIFSPKTVSNLQNEAYPNTSPDLVLKNLELAYRQKDIELYKKCLDQESFRFELISSEVQEINAGVDVDHDGITDSWWGYQREIEYHQNLFRNGSSDQQYPSPDQIYLNLTIPSQDQWELDNQTGHEGWIIIACLFDLTLSFSASNSNLSANGSARFYLKPVADSHGVNHWYIAIWRDESNI
ncbi:MAG TPA: hypothetical protein PLE74_03960 [Candidatus Cloacimonadota bacterium]|nr:hypothetical protein [Candidatus Cloacimonadota bacterium]HPT71415.1 hypothetical protein [Candidatus Cloacimonadota bacterium]